MNCNNQTPNTRKVYEAPCILDQLTLKRRNLLETFSLEATFEDFEEDEHVDL